MGAAAAATGVLAATCALAMAGADPRGTSRTASGPSSVPSPFFVACTSQDRLARRGALDVRRWLYRQTGVLPDLLLGGSEHQYDTSLYRAGGVHVAVAPAAHGAESRLLAAAGVPVAELASAGAGSHAVHALPAAATAAATNGSSGGAPTVVAAVGATGQGAMYASYTLLERLGVRHRIGGDVLQDALVRAFLPETVLGRVSGIRTGVIAPAFGLRGLQPFHDFTAGPDWWNEQEYRLIFEQMGKLKLNFMGLHTYPIKPRATPGAAIPYPDKPARPVGDICGILSAPEPNVWIGLEGEFDQKTGAVAHSYPSTYASTFGYIGPDIPRPPSPNASVFNGVAMNTSRFLYGAAAAFAGEDYSSEAQMAVSAGSHANPGGLPASPAQSNALFNEVGGLFRRSFSYGRDTLGVKIAVGTEIPLAKPPVRVPTCTIAAPSRCLQPPQHRSMPGCVPALLPRAAPAASDWPWMMTRERCAGLCYDEFGARRAMAAVSNGTKCYCGNASEAMSATATALEGSCNVACPGNRSETCGGICASNVFAFECTGPKSNATPTTQAYYEGIFKRIAAAYPIDYYWFWTPEGWEWSRVPVNSPLVTDALADLKAASAAHAAVNASFDLATCGWILGPHGDRALLDRLLGKEFVALASIEQVLGNWGPNPAYAEVKRPAWDIVWLEDDGHLGEPQFWVGRVLQHAQTALTMGVKGLMGIHWRTRELTLQIAALAKVSWTASLTAYDVYLDVVHHDFGLSGGDGYAVAAILNRHDSFSAVNTPPISGSTLGGNGGCATYSPNSAWRTARIEESFAYVNQLLGYRGKVEGAGNLARFDYLVGQHCLMRSQAHAFALWGRFHEAFTNATRATAGGARLPAALSKQLLALRIDLVRNVTQLMNNLMATVSSAGSLGTLSDFQQRGLPYMFQAYNPALVVMIGQQLPAEAHPPRTYQGTDRIFVLSPRGSVEATEATYNVTAIAFTKLPARNVTLHWRVATRPPRPFASVLMTKVPGRQVYKVEVSHPKTVGAMIEWYCSCSDPHLVWPAGGDADGGQFTTIVVD